MFAYCENNPVNRSDPSGEIFWEAALGGAIAGALIGAASSALNALHEGRSVSAKVVLTSAAIGAVCGGIAGFLSPAAEIYGICYGEMTIKAVGSAANGLAAFSLSLLSGADLYDSISSGLSTAVSTFAGLGLVDFPFGEGSAVFTASTAIGGFTVGGCVEGLATVIKTIVKPANSGSRRNSNNINPGKNKAWQHYGGGGRYTV